MNIVHAVAKARNECLSDNEEPRDLLISSDLKNRLKAEIGSHFRVASDPELETASMFGMKIEWTKPVPLKQPQVSIRTASGDLRVVNFL